MTAIEIIRLSPQPEIRWEKLPPDFILPDDPVENICQPLLAAALREILDLADLITPNMLVGSNFGLCATVNNKIVVKAPDWFYIPSVLPLKSGIIRRSYTPHLEGYIPTIVMEFLSDSEQNEQSEYSAKSTYPYGKWYFYERILQVPIYIIFEPKQGLLEVHFLTAGRYELQTPNKNRLYWLESLQLFLGVWQGKRAQLTTNWLRWWDNSGNLLPWANERVEQRFQEGIEQGIEQGKLEMINRLLRRKLGEIEPNLQSKITTLSAANLDQLSEDLLDFSNLSDLENWLEQL